jgi:hypothetical protein
VLFGRGLQMAGRDAKAALHGFDFLGFAANTNKRLPIKLLPEPMYVVPPSGRTNFGGTGAHYNEASGQGLYILRNPRTGVIEYVGRGDAPSRIAAHALPGSGKEGLVAEILWSNNLPMPQAVSLERELMHLLGGPRSLRPNTVLRNQIDSLSPSNPNHVDWEFAADDALLIETLRRAGLLQ